MLWGWFDPVYFIFLAPAMLLAIWAQMRVKSAFAWASTLRPSSGYTGAQAAAALLESAGINDVQIVPTQGFLSDHYVPGEHVLRLSPDVYSGRSLAALGVAAHECGHALQDAQRYPLLVMRNALVPAASVGSSASWVIMMVGFFMASTQLILLGIAAFSLTVIFQLVNLPVEFDASRRARIALVDSGLITTEEDQAVGKVLNAAALTYVAATISAILTLLYFLYRSGLLGGRRS
jgi:uncharacterized protein